MAEEQLKSQGFSVINPARVNAALPEDTTTYEEYMKKLKDSKKKGNDAGNYETSAPHMQNFMTAFVHVRIRSHR